MRLHVDNVMSSHVKPKVNDNFKEWINRNYSKHGELKANWGKVHKYHEMNFEFTGKVKVKINMDDYV